MTIEQRKRQLAVRTGILGVSLLIGISVGVVACGNKSSSSDPTDSAGSEMESVTESVSETPSETETGAETVTETTVEIPEPTLDPAVLTYVEVEVGEKSELLTEDFFSEYTGQVFKVEKVLTPEELRIVGATYEVPILCDEVAGVVTVKVVDTTAPVIAGTKNRTLYLNSTASYRKGVTVSDNSGENVELQIDASAVDRTTIGSYPLTFSATDSSGNTAEVAVTIRIIAPKTEEAVREKAEEIVNSIVTDGMSEYDKAWKLYRWVKSHLVYVGTDGDRTSIWTGAYEGFFNGRGDCYTFYATYAVLLEVVGIENMMVTRVGERTSNHYWNLVKVDGQWYHCDISPRREQDKWWHCFLQTDAQVEAYTRSYPEKPNYYTFEKSLYPERATTIIYESRNDDGYTITDLYGTE